MSSTKRPNIEEREHVGVFINLVTWDIPADYFQKNRISHGVVPSKRRSRTALCGLNRLRQ